MNKRDPWPTRAQFKQSMEEISTSMDDILAMLPRLDDYNRAIAAQALLDACDQLQQYSDKITELKLGTLH